jgi:hypothetical protein
MSSAVISATAPPGGGSIQPAKGTAMLTPIKGDGEPTHYHWPS